jgi:predicted metal-dependent peptidase
MPATLSPVTAALSRAKLRARAWMPYMSHILSSMRTIVSPEIGTMGVDEDCRLYVNPPWVEQLSANELAYVLLHEVLHVVLSHGRRRREALPNASEEQCYWWNVAADLCVQQMLARHQRAHEPKHGVKIDGKVPETDIPFLAIPGLKVGMSTEAYYGILTSYFSRLPKDQRPKPGKKGTKKDGGKSLDPSNASSNSDGVRRDYEKPTRLSEQAGLRSKLSECEKKIAEMEAKGIGTAPGELKQSIAARLRPQPDPFELLKAVTSKSVASTIGEEFYTYFRHSRRQQPDAPRKRGVIRFSPECSIIVDTSGSMGSNRLRDRALTAVAQGLRKVQRPRVVCFDTRVADARRLTSMKDFHWCGGGGTNMAGACEQEDKKQRPDAIVVITDGITGWPAKPTRARLIVALCAPSSSPPKWAKVVRCYEEGPKYAG